MIAIINHAIESRIEIGAAATARLGRGFDHGDRGAARRQKRGRRQAGHAGADDVSLFHLSRLVMKTGLAAAPATRAATWAATRDGGAGQSPAPRWRRGFRNRPRPSGVA